MAYSSHKRSSSPYSIEYHVLRFLLSEGLAWCQKREPQWLWVEGAIRRSKGLWIGSNLAFLVGKRKNLSEDSFLLKETHLDTKDCNWKKKKVHKRQLDHTDKIIGNNQSRESKSGRRAKSNARGETFERKKEIQPAVNLVKTLWKAEENGPCLAIHRLGENDDWKAGVLTKETGISHEQAQVETSGPLSLDSLQYHPFLLGDSTQTSSFPRNLLNFRNNINVVTSSASIESTCNERGLGSIPGLGRSSGEGKGYPLQYSGLENSMDWIAHGVAKSWTRLSDFHFHYIY